MNEIESIIKTPADAKVAIFYYINARLVEWASWFKEYITLGIGYPPCSVEYRLMTEGHVTREYIGLKPMPSNPAAEEIERIVQDMAACCYPLAEVIRCYYFTNGDIYYKARKIAYSRTQFNETLANARWWLVGRLATHPTLERLISQFKRLQEPENGKNIKFFFK